MSLMNRLISDDPLIRAMSLRSVLGAFAQGAFLTGSAVFFTQIARLSPTQVGLGLTIATAAAFAFSVPLGRLADRVGTREAWFIGSLIEGPLFLSWIWVHSMTAYVIVSVAAQLLEAFKRAGSGAYRLQVFPKETRVRSMAYMRSALNVGFALGAGFGGVILAFNDLSLVRLVPIFTAGVLLLSAALVLRLPRLERPAHHERAAGPTSAALRNRGFLLVTILDGVLSTHQVLLNTVIPLWLVEETNAPRVLLAWLFGTACVMVVVCQVRFARGVTNVATALRAEYRAAGAFVVSCAIIWVTDSTTAWVTIALVWLAHLTVTAAEMWQSAGEWGLVAELSDPRNPAEYQGVLQLGNTLGNVWAPAAYTWLAIHAGMSGWLTIAGIVALAAAAIGPAARAAERHLRTAEDSDQLIVIEPTG